MSYQKPNDPMAKVVIAVSSLVLLVAVAVLLMNLFSTYQRNTIATDEIVDTSEVSEPVAKEKTISKSEATANKNIKPIGIVDASSSTQTAASNGPMSGEDIFNATCTACHTPGLLESPKLGDKAAWEPRLVNGFDALLASSIAGKGAMPPKGGNASLSDSEMKATIIYMLEKSGIDAGVSVDAPAPAAEAAPVTEAPATTENTETAAPTADVATATPAATEVSEETTQDAAATEVAPVQPTAPAATVAPEAPEQPAAPATSEAEVAVEAEATPAMGGVVEETTEPATATTEVAAAPTTSGSASGEELYKTKCFVCHAAGVAGAPILGNKEQWAPRIAQGKDVLYGVAMNGKGAMPPKGTAMDASEDEIKATVDYMVSQAQ